MEAWLSAKASLPAARAPSPAKARCRIAARISLPVLVERLSGLPRKLAEVVADIVVDRVWSALARVVEAHVPLLGEDTLRALRMLTLFACPSVEQHREVYIHAAKPLMGDALGLVSDEVHAQVRVLFNAWWRRSSEGFA